VWAVAVAATVAIALRIPFVNLPAFPDEGGFLIVARSWHPGGPGLYGDLWVDRPPLLMLFWRLAAAAGGIDAARWLACALVCVLVVSAGWSGWLLAGRRGAIWSAVTAAALASSPMLAAQEVNGELVAAPLVMVSCLAALKAVRTSGGPRVRAAWAVGAGVAGAAAVLVKQNFVDSLVFAAVLVLMLGVRGTLPWPRALRTLAWGAFGAFIPALATVVWAWRTGPGLGELWFTLYGFRSQATQVILSHSLTAPEGRLALLIGLGLGSGVFLLTATFVWCRRRGLLRDPILTATAAMLAVGYVGVASGGSYWPHYLIGLIPALALASASLSTDSTFRGPAGNGRLRGVRRAVSGAVIASSLVATGTAVATATPVNDGETNQVVDSLRPFVRAHDTAFVSYGHANVLESAGLAPGYRYLWSLPMRTLDPDLNLLVRTVSGPSAPTWFVQWDPLDSWKIDLNGRLTDAIAAHYRVVARVCGVVIYLHDGVDRPGTSTARAPSSKSCP
jgi:hypothetical protein